MPYQIESDAPQCLPYSLSAPSMHFFILNHLHQESLFASTARQSATLRGSPPAAVEKLHRPGKIYTTPGPIRCPPLRDPCRNPVYARSPDLRVKQEMRPAPLEPTVPIDTRTAMPSSTSLNTLTFPQLRLEVRTDSTDEFLRMWLDLGSYSRGTSYSHKGRPSSAFSMFVNPSSP